MKIKETKEALKDRKLILKSYPKLAQSKLKYFVEDILEDPRNLNAVGNPEELRHCEFPTFSRSLSEKDRIVYEIRAGKDFDMPEENEIVVFYQYLGHYKDK
ncbi:MAG: type II toxin-antitoxin system YoeB family toxin [Bacteroidetes bacterium]|nr:type II toxin-antitoxin system YoeB family toxin [Bacteroidota bacterium]